MAKRVTLEEIKAISEKFGYEYNVVRTIIIVESTGYGFDPATGKIIIQFEPGWFKRLRKNAPHGIWAQNKVENQTREWIAFNDAFRIDPNAAMKATSIGMMQVMGFHFKSLGFNSVGEMWDFAKESEINQIELGLRFIHNNPILEKDLKTKNWVGVALRYNGEKYYVSNYDKKLKKTYEGLILGQVNYRLTQSD